MDSEYDRYIVVSFVDVTLVLSIGDTVEEAAMGKNPGRAAVKKRGKGREIPWNL